MVVITSVVVPKERVRVFNRKTLEALKKHCSKITVSENVVYIEGEGLGSYQTQLVVKAIARGFSPNRAFKIFNDKELVVLEIKGNKNDLRRIRARIIGTGGKTRKRLEAETGCLISIYGKTVSIIGDYGDIEIARKAVEMLIKGASHKFVYKFIQTKTGN